MNKITKVTVRNLFGIFNHQIPINIKDHITIIHGPNGIGKTVILTMINSLFNRKYSIFYRIPFASFEIEFEDGTRLNLKKELAGSSRERPQRRESYNLVLEYYNSSSKSCAYTIKPFSREKIAFPMSIIEREIPGLERIGPTSWLFAQTDEILSIEDVIDRFQDDLPILRRETEPEPDWFAEILGSLSVHFIEAQRLLTLAKTRRIREYPFDFPMVPAVKKYSEDLVKLIQAKLSDYANLSQSLDRSFPLRLVTATAGRYSDNEELRDELEKLEQEITRLEEAGVLDKGQSDLGQLLKINFDPDKIQVLSVYINDVKQKLKVLNDLANKIDLLLKIINARFLYKKMTISKKDGFSFTGSNDKEIPLENLSSGEQHELVLFYELLFKVDQNSLVLLDEPELSLHIVWQQQFLSDLEEITKLSGFDILLATHSPQVIYDRWDLTVELMGPEDVSTCK